jgi:hypothetical protein
METNDTDIELRSITPTLCAVAGEMWASTTTDAKKTAGINLLIMDSLLSVSVGCPGQYRMNSIAMAYLAVEFCY